MARNVKNPLRIEFSTIVTVGDINLLNTSLQGSKLLSHLLVPDFSQYNLLCEL